MTLTLKDVTKRFKKRVAVDRFSMEFQPEMCIRDRW